MTFDEIVNAAREATGLPDPDKDTWQEGLQIAQAITTWLIPLRQA